MMNFKNLALLGGLGLAAVSLTPAAASAAFEGWTTRTVTEHAGPGRNYPPVGVVPGGVKVRIFGCLRRITFCDISWRGNRGWVNGNALAGFYHNKRVSLLRFGAGIPYITFNFGYWDDNYRNKPFFKQRGNWDKNWKKDSDSNYWDKKKPKQISGPPQSDNGLGMDQGQSGPGKKGKGRDRHCKPGETGDDCKPMNP